MILKIFLCVQEHREESKSTPCQYNPLQVFRLNFEIIYAAKPIRMICLASLMGYDRGDSFPFNFESNTCYIKIHLYCRMRDRFQEAVVRLCQQQSYRLQKNSKALALGTSIKEQQNLRTLNVYKKQQSLHT